MRRADVQALGDWLQEQGERMVSWLEQQGMKAMHKETLRAIRAAVRHIENTFTTELEKYMAPLNESIDRLSQAITTELDQVRQEAERNLQETKDALEAASSDNAELNAALEQQVANSQGLVDTISSAKQRLDDLSSGFEANDPRVDNSLPGSGGGNPGEHPDNTLPNPDDQPHPDQGLPGDQPQVNPLSGKRGKK
jgi:chromosome segregation ATPase